MNLLPHAIEEAIEALSNLPGIGNRSAERLIFTLLRNETGLEKKIAESLLKLKDNVHECEQCYHLSEETLCPICKSHNRNKHVLCVIETPMDLIALERTHEFKGLYHVLHGTISPLKKIKPEDIRLQQLFDRIKKDNTVEEIILALSGNTESDATALYIVEHIQPFFDGKITRLARGIPSGGDLDYLDMGTLTRAMMDRREF